MASHSPASSARRVHSSVSLPSACSATVSGFGAFVPMNGKMYGVRMVLRMHTVARFSSSIVFGPSSTTFGAVRNAARFAVYVAVTMSTRNNSASRKTRPSGDAMTMEMYRLSMDS